MKPLLLVGCGGHARSLIDLIETTSEWRIHGLVGLPDQVGSQVLGYSVVGTDDQLPDLQQHCDSAVLAVGQLPDPSHRQHLAHLLQKQGFHSPRLISPPGSVTWPT